MRGGVREGDVGGFNGGLENVKNGMRGVGGGRKEEKRGPIGAVEELEGSRIVGASMREGKLTTIIIVITAGSSGRRRRRRRRWQV